MRPLGVRWRSLVSRRRLTHEFVVGKQSDSAFLRVRVIRHSQLRPQDECAIRFVVGRKLTDRSTTRRDLDYDVKR
jgi:hypothetical protein